MYLGGSEGICDTIRLVGLAGERLDLLEVQGQLNASRRVVSTEERRRSKRRIVDTDVVDDTRRELEELVSTEEADLDLVRHSEEHSVFATRQAVILELLHDLTDHGGVCLRARDQPEDELVCTRRHTLEE